MISVFAGCVLSSGGLLTITYCTLQSGGSVWIILSACLCFIEHFFPRVSLGFVYQSSLFSSRVEKDRHWTAGFATSVGDWTCCFDVVSFAWGAFDWCTFIFLNDGVETASVGHHCIDSGCAYCNCSCDCRACSNALSLHAGWGKFLFERTCHATIVRSRCYFEARLCSMFSICFESKMFWLLALAWGGA